MVISRAEALKWLECPRYVQEAWSSVEDIIDQALASQSAKECICISVGSIVKRSRVFPASVLSFKDLILMRYEKAGWEVTFIPPSGDTSLGCFEFR